MEQQVGEFTRSLTLVPAFDKTHPDPKKNYGVHGMDMRFVLKGPLGATQFVVFTNMMLKHVREQQYARVDTSRPYWYCIFEPTGADIGYHSPKPRYEGQQPMPCEILGGECYYDGSSLAADEFLETFLSQGEDAVWTMLEDRYNELFTKESPNA